MKAPASARRRSGSAGRIANPARSRSRGGVGPKASLEGLDRVAFGERDVGRVATSPGRPAVTHASRERRARPRSPEWRRHADREDLAPPVVVGRAGDREADHQCSLDRDRDARALTDRLADQGMSGEGIEWRDHARASVSRSQVMHRMNDRRMADSRGRLGGRLSRAPNRRDWIPPAAVPRHLQQPRHDQPPQDPDRLEDRASATACEIQLQACVRGVPERLRQRRLAVPGALGLPALAPCGRRGDRHLAVAPASQTRLHARGTTRYAS